MGGKLVNGAVKSNRTDFIPLGTELGDLPPARLSDTEISKNGTSEEINQNDSATPDEVQLGDFGPETQSATHD